MNVGLLWPFVGRMGDIDCGLWVVKIGFWVECDRLWVVIDCM